MAMTTAASRRRPLTWAERCALGLAALGVIGFGIYGFAQGEPSTIGYLVSVFLVGISIAVVRRQPLPGWLAIALGALAVGHLAGGLVTVGGDVLYNAHPRLHMFQYDHIFHASASGVAALVLWTFLATEIESTTGAAMVCVLGGLGVGTLNELIEFLATLAHHGSHVGGYRNTGWDLLSNTVGAIGATLAIAVGSAHRQRQ